MERTKQAHTHTPWPWRVVEDERGYVQICDSTERDGKPGRVACDVFNRADARLIASAPDLLRALEEIYAGCEAPQAVAWLAIRAARVVA